MERQPASGWAGIAGPAAVTTEITLAQRLRVLRRDRFVGRDLEIGHFRRLMAGAEAPVLLYVHGFGGVGKTSWLAWCRQLATESGVPVLSIDARVIPAEPARIREALLSHMHGGLTAGVLMIDSFEYWQALESWLRDELLPELPASLRVVVCGRRPPSPEWSLDLAWSGLMQVSQLGNFSEPEAIGYLERRAVGRERWDEAIRYSHGHPLALAMVADLLERTPDAQLDHRIDREITRQLVDRLTREGVHASQRAALEIAAVAQDVDEHLLAALLPESAAGELYAWLSGLSLMIPGGSGLFPHDLIREILMADLLERHRGRYLSLARRIFDYELEQMLLQGQGAWQQVAMRIQRAVYALRSADALDGFLIVDHGGQMYADAARDEDMPALESAVIAFEGEAALQTFRHWCQQPCTELIVLRDAGRRLLGFCCVLALEQTDAGQRAADPVVQALWAHASESGPLPPGGTMRCWRHWMSCAGHQDSGTVATALLSLCFGYTITLPDLAVMSIVTREPLDYWQRFAERVRIDSAPALVVTDGGYRQRGYVCDWRSDSRIDWLRQFSLRVTDGADPGADPAAAAARPAIDLPSMEREAFADAVAEALRNYHQTYALQKSPLLDSRMVARAAGADAAAPARLNALRQLLADANTRLQGVNTTARSARLIHRTYLEPARSQQLAAESLGMGYSTYRRQLALAREMIAAELWQLEQ
jgi:hypothetical protein